MQNLLKDAAVDVAELLKRFSFDLNGFTAEQLAFTWLAQYPDHWVCLSLVEALYQGRYKAISVEQILRFWQRRGQPLYHFNHEFERIIRGRFSRNLLTYSSPASLSTPSPKPLTPPQHADAFASQPLDAEGLNAEQPEDLTSEQEDAIDAVAADGEAESPSLSESEWAFAVVSAAAPSSEEAKADLLEFAASTEKAIQPFSQRLKLLSSEESIAFLKLRSFENDSPLQSSDLQSSDSSASSEHPWLKDLPKDEPIQAFKPVAELEAAEKLKWAKLAIDKSTSEEIHQFTPVAVSPGDFYSKLKAVATESQD
ncbi:MAG: hypothetical protein HY785_08575 [Oscillatoriophycideae cyanobacterium NC_groundwater_1537_Pr4_S-0.65um_50_18]|nr:hypothetical protein [Oscillatoriophycideae cyanobacterium NC_groundwater_1537_Pr4_S-0.65um_50_18]